MPLRSTATSVPAAPSLGDRAVMLAQDFRDIASDHLELAALEVQRAGFGLARMLTAAVVISILVVSAWLALVSGGIVWATTAGVSWVGALALAAILNLILAGVLAWWARRQAGDLLFAATLRQMRRTVDTAGQVSS